MSREFSYQMTIDLSLVAYTALIAVLLIAILAVTLRLVRARGLRARR